MKINGPGFFNSVAGGEPRLVVRLRATVVIPRERTAQGYMVQRASGGYLGIGGLDISPDRAKALNLKEERGVEVSSLAEEGPAAKAGIKEGDVVLEFNGQAVEGTTQFQRLVRETPPGRQVKITCGARARRRR